MNEMDSFSDQIINVKKLAIEKVQPLFAIVDDISEKNTLRVLDIFRKYQVSDYHFRSSTGYAYNDAGRETLDLIWADICGAEKALVRTQFVSGTHALACVLFGIMRPGDELVSITGAPYDTMQTVIGYNSESPGSLREFGIVYDEVPLNNGRIDMCEVRKSIKPTTKAVLIQRSRGYSMRMPLSIREIGEVCSEIKKLNPECICFVDNCYGEFVDVIEPTAVGADIIAGSFIKNAGGGLAPTGGYIAGRADLVEQAACRLTAPGIGSELGASLAGNRLMYQGIFMAPHVTAQAVKGAIFASSFFSLLGYKTSPDLLDKRSDIIQAIELGSPERMIAFCRGLQKYSPVDAHVRPEPSGMPGYSDAIIMAGGTFVQGSSIELSADGPIRAPYAVYLQGGLTFEHAVIGIMGAAEEVLKLN